MNNDLLDWLFAIISIMVTFQKLIYWCWSNHNWTH